jgi:hypothetical protein
VKYGEHHDRFGGGEAGHSLKNAGAIFLDAIRWLWSDDREATKRQRKVAWYAAILGLRIPPQHPGV